MIEGRGHPAFSGVAALFERQLNRGLVDYREPVATYWPAL